MPSVLGLLSVLCFIPDILWHFLRILPWVDAQVLSDALKGNQMNGEKRHAVLRDTAILLQVSMMFEKILHVTFRVTS